MKSMRFEVKNGPTLNDKLFEVEKHTALTTTVAPIQSQYVECQGEYR